MIGATSATDAMFASFVEGAGSDLPHSLFSAVEGLRVLPISEARSDVMFLAHLEEHDTHP